MDGGAVSVSSSGCVTGCVSGSGFGSVVIPEGELGIDSVVFSVLSSVTISITETECARVTITVCFPMLSMV